MFHVIALALGLADPVVTAIERSVQERMGDVRVTVEVSGSRMPEREATTPDRALTAEPEPGSRLGRPVRFILLEGGKRVGSVIAKLDVVGSAVRSARPIARGQNLAEEAIEVVSVDLKDLLIGRMPTKDEIVGTHARRDIRPGEVLTGTAVIVPPVVKSGDEVRVILSEGVVEVTGVGRASGSGHVGDEIRVLLPSSRKGLRARITGPGVVEIVR